MLVEYMLKRFQWGPDNLSSFLLLSADDLVQIMTGKVGLPAQEWSKLNELSTQFEKVIASEDARVEMLTELDCIRQKENWSVATTAEIVGVSRKALSSWFDLSATPSYSSTANILALLINIHHHGVEAVRHSPVIAKFSSLRSRLGVPRRVIGESLGVTAQTVANWEARRNSPPSSLVDRLVVLNRSFETCLSALQSVKNLPVQEGMSAEVVEEIVEDTEESTTFIASQGVVPAKSPSTVVRRSKKGERVKLRVWSANKKKESDNG